MKKNIVLVLADELRADGLGCYGNTQVLTPRTDALAREGIRFAHHFTSHGKCVPSRCALYSGRYPNLGGHRTLGIELQRGEENLAWFLKRNGWETRLFQRNHTIDINWIHEVFDNWEQIPTPNPHFVTGTEVDEMDIRLFNWGVVDDPAYVSTDRIHSDALCKWLREKDRRSIPFFTNLNWINPHPPYHAERRFAERYTVDSLILKPGADSVSGGRGSYWSSFREELGAKDLSDDRRRKLLRNYYSQISACDEHLGNIIDTLKDTGLWESTILIYASDHGDYAGQYGLVEKWDTGFEDCITQIPLILAGGGLPQGMTVSALTESVDLFPTMCDLLEVETPGGLSGRSFHGIWNKPGAEHRSDVFAEGGHERALLKVPIRPEDHNPHIACYQAKARVRNHHPESLMRSKMIRTRNLKYIWRVAESPELYDLKKDPDECVNVVGHPAYQEAACAMKERLLNRLIENEDTRPWDPNPIA